MSPGSLRGQLKVRLGLAVATRVESIPFGVPWAISEGIVRVTGLNDKGAVILDYTEEGLAQLYREAGGAGIVAMNLGLRY